MNIPEGLKDARSLSALDPAPHGSDLILTVQEKTQKYYFYKMGNEYRYETDRVRKYRREREKEREARQRKRWEERQEALEKERLLYG